MKIHFIAIGGSAMHNLAIALHKKGEQVSGSDDEIFEPSLSRLSEYGLLPEKTGWDPSGISRELDVVIAGMHARSDNPELLRAQDLGIKIYSFPEFLFEHSREKTRIVIGGSHGKTTITSMILHVLTHCGIDTDYMVGAQLEGFEVMVKLSDDAALMVMEGDEYPSAPTDPRPKFHIYRPHIAVLSGISWDHINVFKTPEDYIEQFRIFLDKIEENGLLIYSEDDDTVNELCTSSAKPSLRLKPYGLPEYDIRQGITFAENKGKHYKLNFFGKHNLLNMNAARLVVKHLGVTDSMFFDSISTFRGASKRMQVMLDGKYNTVIRDFAHAPSKVRATLEAVRERFPGRKIIACLELHTYSSLNRDFLDQYRGSLDKADEAIVFFSPEAVKIKRLNMLDPDDIRRGFRNQRIRVVNNKEELSGELEKAGGNKTCYIFMSSGTFGGFNTDVFQKKLT